MHRVFARTPASLALLLAAGPSAAWPAPPGLPQQNYEIVQVAEGIHAFVAGESRSGVVQGNIVLIVGQEAALVVDAGQFPSTARRVAADIRRLTDRPVRVLVNTHWHGDHLLANHVLQESFPGLVTVAHAETRRAGPKFYGEWAKQVAEFPRMIQTLRERVATGKKRDGSPLSDDEKAGYAADADDLSAVLADVQDSRYTPADMTFEDEVTFHLGGREVRVSRLGRGNTAGDAVLWVPDAKVLVTGDTVVYPTPYSFGSFHGDWIGVLERMIALQPAKVVPGHGPVMSDTSYLRTLIELLAETRRQVRAAVQAGLNLEQTRKKVDLRRFERRLAGDSPDRARAFRDFFLVPGLERAYKEAKGEPLEE
jgi:glyoxylase-like metal-dependent hydrolase (beta-lactamase superfamily II)